MDVRTHPFCPGSILWVQSGEAYSSCMQVTAGLSKPESMNCFFAQSFLLFLTSDAKWRRGEREFGVYPLWAPRQPADLAHHSGLFVFQEFVNLITQMESELMQTRPACDWLPHEVVY